MSSERASTLGEHLAEMDQLLHDIQTELVPGREPGPVLSSDPPVPPIPDPPAPAPPPPIPEPAPPPPPEPPPIPDPVPPEPPPPPPLPEPALDHQIRALTELSERLVAAMRELLDGYERLLAPASRSGRTRLGGSPEPAGVTLTAGPFASIEALHEFEEALARLGGVSEVTVRGYQGTDRAVIDVRLA